MHKIIKTALVIFFIIWCIRIIEVNQNKEIITEYKMNEWFAIKDWNIQVVEACLYDRDEFQNRFGIDSFFYCSNPDVDYRMLCVRVLVKNTQEVVLASQVYQELVTLGFETMGWAAIGSSQLYSIVNDVYSNDLLEINQYQEVWYLVYVNDGCFREKTWNNLSNTTFYMSPSRRPEKIRVPLEFETKERKKDI